MTDFERDLGRVEGKMDSMSEQVATVHIKLDRLLSGECIKGKANKEEIDKIDVRVKKVEFTLAKAIVAGLLVAGSGTGIAKVLEAFM